MSRSFPVFSLCAILFAAGACARPAGPGRLAAGVAAAEDGRWDEAVRFWTAAVERDPGSAAAHNNLAVALERTGDWEGAGREYEAALRLAPDSPEIRANHGAFKLRLEAGRRKGP